MKVRYFRPLLGFLAMAFVAWLSAVMAGGAIGFNALAAGFGVTVTGAVLTYTVGVRMVAQCPECHNYVARSSARPRQRPASDRGAVAGSHRSATKFRYFVPLLAFAVPAAGIGFTMVILNSSAAGLDAFAVAYGATLVAACITYPLGLWAVLTDHAAPHAA